MRRARLLAPLAVLGAAAASFACSHECLALPCALPVAVVVSVTSGTPGAAVAGAVVRVTGAATTTLPCEGLCRVPGTSGTYDLEVTAPGFATVRRSVTVQGTNPPCGCPSVVTENVAVTLVGG